MCVCVREIALRQKRWGEYLQSDSHHKRITKLPDRITERLYVVSSLVTALWPTEGISLIQLDVDHSVD